MLVPRATALAAVAVAGAVALSTQVSADGVRSSSPAAAQVVIPQARSGLDVIGLTDRGRLVSFSSDAPRQTRNLGNVGRLDDDRSLVGIDYRVQDGKLYGVGDSGGIYTIRPRRGNVWATKVSQLSVPLVVRRSASTSTRPRTGCVSSVTSVRTSGTTSTTRSARLPLASPCRMAASSFPGVPPAPPTPAFGRAAAAYLYNDLDANVADAVRHRHERAG